MVERNMGFQIEEVYRFQSRHGNMDIPPSNCQRKNDPVCSCCLVGNSFIIRDLSDIQLKERRAVICLIHIRNKAAVINSLISLNRLESNTGFKINLMPKLMDYKVSTYLFLSVRSHQFSFVEFLKPQTESQGHN